MCERAGKYMPKSRKSKSGMCERGKNTCLKAEKANQVCREQE